MNAELPDDTIVGIKPDDFDFLRDYIDGKVTQEQLLARFGDENGRVCIPVYVVDGGVDR